MGGNERNWITDQFSICLLVSNIIPLPQLAPVGELVNLQPQLGRSGGKERIECACVRVCDIYMVCSMFRQSLLQLFHV